MHKNKKHVVRLTAEQRRGLERRVRTGRDSAAKLTRARILLKADENAEGCGDSAIVSALGVGVATVERVRRAFARRGLDAAIGRKPQPPRPHKRILDGQAEARLVMLACSRAPEGHDHWTLDLLADRLVKLAVVPAVSRDTVGRVLKKTSSSRG